MTKLPENHEGITL